MKLWVAVPYELATDCNGGRRLLKECLKCSRANVQFWHVSKPISCNTEVFGECSCSRQAL
jgi:hypothetical protein